MMSDQRRVAVLQHEQFAWAVVIGESKFALDGHGVRLITGKKKDAQAFAKELAEHVSQKCKPVRVRVLIETV
jgi:hypothetical protein